MENNNFKNICEKEFKFLINKFGYKLYKFSSDAWGEEIIYKSNNVGITIRFEARDSHIFLIMHRLIKGKIPDYHIFINANSSLNSFYIDDLLTFRNAHEQEIRVTKKQFSGRDRILDLEKILKGYANLIQKYAYDVLQGDFSIFSELDKIVKRRIGKKSAKPEKKIEKDRGGTH